MADMNPFDLLGDEAEDPSQLIAAKAAAAAAAAAAQPKKALAQEKTAGTAAQQQQAKPAAKLPSKPLSPSQAVREARAESARGGGRGGGRGYGRGRAGGGFNREELTSNENPLANKEFSGVQGAPDEGDARKPFERRGGYGGPRGSFRGGRRGGFSNGDVGEGERPRRAFERRSGTGRGNEIKREGSGRGNWGTPNDELAQVTEEGVNEVEKDLNLEKPSGKENATEQNKETPANEAEQKEPEDKEMTLEEYEKVLEEKRKALQALKTEERKVDATVFESMQQLNKKSDDEIFIKLGFDKDKRKESTEKEEKVKKSVSINEFLKPAEGERYYNPGGRGRGRGRSNRGGYGGGSATINVETPPIEDPGHFPTLGAK